MSLKKALYTYLTAQVGITNLVSTRLYPSVAPESAAKPYAVFSEVTSDHKHHLTASAGLVIRRIQIDLYGTTALGLDALKEAFRAELDGFRGVMGTDSLDVRHVMLSNEIDGFNNPIDGDQTGIHTTILEYEICHSESVPTF